MIQKTCLIIIIGLAVLLAFLAGSCSATPIPIAFKGTVTEMNEANQTLTVHSECQQYPCQYNLNGSFIGRVPNTVVFSRVKEGDFVEAVFKDWTFHVTDPSEGYILPSAETRDLRQWYTIQLLAYQPGTDTLVATELFGDPGVSRVPFAEDYTIQYRLAGPRPAIYDFQTFPPETIANISIRRDSGPERSVTLATNESCSISDRRNESAMLVKFIGGYDAGYLVGKACPCADFHIRVLYGEELATAALAGTTPAQPAAGPLPVPAVLTMIAIVLGLNTTRRR
ncbi:MAG: hypothetical protein M0Q92_00075 [Methanoregula sp.]|jgi:hypothetical protein|nr:hypothetical protein [Methanoregula sp.]